MHKLTGPWWLSYFASDSVNFPKLKIQESNSKRNQVTEGLEPQYTTTERSTCAQHMSPCL